MTDLFAQVWEECYGEALTRSPEFDPSDYYKSGRASKAWPEKETPQWWAENGPRFVQLWERWRDNCGLSIMSIPQVDLDTGEYSEVPGIEVETWAQSDDDRKLYLKSVIDRVMVDDNDTVYIVDLKTGSHTQPWPLQLALNNLGLKYEYGIEAKWAGYWKARTGTIEKWHDLSIYTDDMLWEWVWKAREIRDQHLFIPNPNNLCKSACGVSQYCAAMGGTPFFPTHATLTHNHEEKE